MTLPYYRALCRRWAERERRQDLRFGTLLANYFNSAQSLKKYAPGEFFDHILNEEEKLIATAGDMQADFAMATNAAIGRAIGERERI